MNIRGRVRGYNEAFEPPNIFSQQYFLLSPNKIKRFNYETKLSKLALTHPNNHILSITVILSYTLVTIHTEVESLVHCYFIQPIIIHQNLKLSCLQILSRSLYQHSFILHIINVQKENLEKNASLVALIDQKRMLLPLPKQSHISQRRTVWQSCT